MSHLRKQIRDKIITLVTGLATTGANVFNSRSYPLQSSELPGLCVYTKSEETDDEEGKLDIFDDRSLNVSIQAYDRVSDGLPDTLDDIAEEVETAILANEFLDDLAVQTDVIGFTTDFVSDGENRFGMMELTVRVRYRTERGAPGTQI